MLIILSPAKTMDMTRGENTPAGTKPFYEKDAEFIASKIQEYSREQLQILLQISNKLTDSGRNTRKPGQSGYTRLTSNGKDKRKSAYPYS